MSKRNFGTDRALAVRAGRKGGLACPNELRTFAARPGAASAAAKRRAELRAAARAGSDGKPAAGS